MINTPEWITAALSFPSKEGVLSSRADIHTAAQRAMNTHHPTATAGCAECKTTHPAPCPVWTLASQVIALVNENIHRYPPPRPNPGATNREDSA